MENQPSPLVPNALEQERLARGLATQEELAERAGIEPGLYADIEAGRILPTAQELDRLAAALGGISVDRLYVDNYSSVIGALEPTGEHAYAGFHRQLAETSHMLLARDELSWLERPAAPERQAEVYVNLSCSTQSMPHLLLDTVAVLDALAVDFVAAAGAVACCGKPFRRRGRQDRGERVGLANLQRALSWGARVHVNWCTACQITSTTTAARRSLVDGVDHPVREVQLFTFLEERLAELRTGTDGGPPWQRSVERRVLVEGHAGWSPVHREAQLSAARLVAQVPGVEVVEIYEAPVGESPCTMLAPPGPEGRATPVWPATPDGISAQRAWLTDHVAALGADTVSCQHQYCHQLWSRFAGDRLSVRHPISILAEALGCDHADRYQAATRLGDPREFARQTRPVWESWGMTEERALALAETISDPTFADRRSDCGCGGSGGGCSEHLITIDVLAGTSMEAPR
jgi:transcriptional regulator with XRE-family HTH domain